MSLPSLSLSVILTSSSSSLSSRSWRSLGEAGGGGRGTGGVGLRTGGPAGGGIGGGFGGSAASSALLLLGGGLLGPSVGAGALPLVMPRFQSDEDAADSDDLAPSPDALTCMGEFARLLVSSPMLCFAGLKERVLA